MKNRGKSAVQYGLYVPNFGKASYARTLADLAREAEEYGWDLWPEKRLHWIISRMVD